MPRHQPSASAIGVGSIVVVVMLAGATIAVAPNVLVGIGLFAGAVVVTAVLVVWYVIGSHNERADKAKADAAQMEVQRRIVEALASVAKPSGPAAIRTGRHTTMANVQIEGYEQAIDAERSETLTMEDVCATAPNRAAPPSPRRSKRGR